MKKALAGPAKRTAKKKPERRAMIAAAGRRSQAASGSTAKRLAATLRSLGAATRKVDRAADRQLRRAWPRLAQAGRSTRLAGNQVGRRLRPVGVLIFRALAWLERRLLRAASWSERTATRVSGVLPPRRGICVVILGSAGCLIAAQFIDYRAVQIGQAGYAGLAAASAPTVGAETAGEAHSYLLIPVALLAGALALVAMRNQRRDGTGRVVFGLGLLSLAVALLVDLPAGLDVGAAASRFSGAEAVVYDGFYAEIAAAGGLMLGGTLLVMAPRAAARYHARPCRTRTNLFARAVSALRRRPRRRASSRGRAARRGSPRRSGEASAPASPR
jgi:hypothetical protein